MPYEIRLIITRTENTYTARWVDAAGGQESQAFPLTLPIDKAKAARLRWYLEEYVQFPGAGDRVKAQAVEAELETWGRALFDAVFGTAEGREVYRNLTEAVRDGQTGLITLGSVEPEVLVQPWEMLRDVRGPLALRDITVRRQLQGARPTGRFNLALPLRILLIVCRPTDTGFIDPRNSIPPVLDALDALPGLVEVEFCTPPTLAQLEQMIAAARRARRPYHLVHFDGHGTYLPQTGVGALAFERADATTDLVAGRDLGDLLSRLEIPLVLLEACRGADLAERPVFGSVAPALLQSGVGSVVAFSHAVHIRAARLFVERFYRELAAARSIGTALQEARAALRATRDRFLHLGPNADFIELQDWFIPQLYQVGEDALLVPPAALPSAPLLPSASAVFPQLPASFPPAPRYRFHGRALELLELERAFRHYPAVVVSGMGGMGKTALAREAAAWWLRVRLFDTAVFISFEQSPSADHAVQELGRALEGPAFASRSGDDTDPQGQWQTAIRLFHEKRALVVWDNFESVLPTFASEELRVNSEELGAANGPSSLPNPQSPITNPQLPLIHHLFHALTANTPRSRLLVTCRPLATGLRGAREFALAGLARPDTLHLLAAVLDQLGVAVEKRAGYEREALDALLTQLSDHPLSVELVAPHLRSLTPARICADFAQLLERFAHAEAAEGRNKSLLASLEFSRQHLSPAAQAALPWLAWFAGGVFEMILLDFAQFDQTQWAALRAELTATALVKVEDLAQFNSPYLRFHPTLAYATAPAQDEAIARRFLDVYRAVNQMVYDALRGQQPAAGMALMAREEGNVRRALTHAAALNDRHALAKLAGTLDVFLQMAARHRERAALTQWVQTALPPQAQLDWAACQAIQQHAWTTFTQGHAQQAVALVQGLIARLGAEGVGDDPNGVITAFQLALSHFYLGRILSEANRPDLAIPSLHTARTGLAQLSQTLAHKPDQSDLLIQAQANLAATLGTLANAHCALGQYPAALAAAEEGIAINRALKRDREVAAGLGQIAQILAAQHRYPEAEARYADALRAAEEAGDGDLQGSLLQHLGILHINQGHFARAVALLQQALTLFQRAHDRASEMRTCNLLAAAEAQRGELDAAEAWYGRSAQLAAQLHDRHHQAGVAQNLGILYQDRAEQAEQRGDAAGRAQWLGRAMASVGESLAIKLENNNQVGAASSYFQLGVLHLLAGQLAEAEQNLLKSAQISEALNLPELWMVYGHLAKIARARGQAAEAEAWEAKYKAKREEIERLERGEGAARVNPELGQFVLGLAQACYAIRANRVAPPPDVAEALAQLAAAPAPLGDLGAWLQAVATGQPLPPPPSPLPEELDNIVQALAKAVQKG